MKEFTNPLRLVTPHMRGDRVKDAQYLLAGNNRFKGLATYKNGAIDGDYGALTAQATKRAKYWLGYPDSSLDTVFGQTIFEFLRLSEWRPLPEEYRRRRDARIRQMAASTPGERAFKEAEKHIGYTEEPRHNINDNMFGRWYKMNYAPWCAMFESYCFYKTGTPAFHYAAVEQIYWDAMANRNRLFIVRTPKQGDIIGYSLHGDPYAHTAFFDRWINDNTLGDLGGNTGPTDISNGGMVMKQNRNISLVHFYARVSTIN